MRQTRRRRAGDRGRAGRETFGDDLAVAIAAGLALAIALRLVNQRVAGATAAVDRWFWRLYVERSRSGHGFPPRLPQYLLDEEQWYPPLFPWLLVRTPARILAPLEPWLGVVLDLLRLLLVVLVCGVLLPGDAPALAVAATAFAVSPILVMYNAQPNPRALAALWLDGLFVAVAVGLMSDSLWPWATAVLMGALVLLTHKMTTQLLAFLLLAGSLATGDPRPALALGGAVVLAMAMSRGFYRKVLAAHWDILTFWNRNWRWLGADPVRESPVYGDAGFESAGRHHAAGVAGALRHARRLLRLLPAVWTLGLPLVVARSLPSHPASATVGALLALQLSFALLTIYAPPLKCLGSGHLYLYNAASPTALLWALWISATPSGASWLGLAAGLAASALAIGHFWRGVRRAEARHADGWHELVEYLRTAPRGPVLCLPMGLYDELAYRTGQPVLFGGHGLGFRRLEPVFPVLRLSVSEMQERYGLGWLVARDDALSGRLLADLRQHPERRFGAFRLFAFDGQGEPSPSPDQPPGSSSET